MLVGLFASVEGGVRIDDDMAWPDVTAGLAAYLCKVLARDISICSATNHIGRPKGEDNYTAEGSSVVVAAAES